LPPDIAVEVLSPTERSTDSQRKLLTYLKSGVREVWQVVSAGQRVLVYRDTNSFTILEVGQSLTTPLLPGWELPIQELFGA